MNVLPFCQNSNSSAAGTAQWWCQREATYEIGYNASFPVMGGGTISLDHLIGRAF